MVWAMGNGVLRGSFLGTTQKSDEGNIMIMGVITYEYSDRFEDPFDALNLLPGSIDLFGTPYDISEIWHVPVSTIVSKNK